MLTFWYNVTPPAGSTNPNAMYMLLAFHVTFVLSESDPWPHMGRGELDAVEGGKEVGDGVMTTLRVSGVSVIWILELKI